MLGGTIGVWAAFAFVVVSVLVWRTGLFPRWTAVPALLGGLMFVPSREVDLGWLALLADSLLTVALVPIALAMRKR